ncbi:Gfo/Idh/MocA family protein [Clostridium cuniculi]|uniref:Gfo/Idh/MocA family protein n=1 Tax=Clostridium cuniculi TaxID=2548455 RepID=UPI001056BB58|nr:Gfo/Idh/MocA family oxidoreductase [Clostridium cuniculi]
MKLAIIGSGMIVKDFLEIMPYLNGVELRAIYGRKGSEEKLNRLKSQHNIKEIFYDYEELLKSDIDTVYIALPNNLHFEFSKKALEENKNVIVEKPITSNYKEAKILSDLARERNLFIFEAITTEYLPNYLKIKELLPKLGDIKIVQCNYSQYSSRYNSFKEGNVLPAFDPEFSGGALMDINIYNIHYVVGLFGRPKNIEYYPNIEKEIDTSGILILDYDRFKCVCVGAKDCKAPIANNIQGNNGCIYVDTPVNSCENLKVIMNDGTTTVFNENKYDNRMVSEFIEFIDTIHNNDLERCYKMLDHSLIVSEVQTIARKKAGIIFKSDIN